MRREAGASQQESETLASHNGRKVSVPTENAGRPGHQRVGGKFGSERSAVGVDVSGLRYHLRLTPAERLASMVSSARFAAAGRSSARPDRYQPSGTFDPLQVWCHLAKRNVEYVLIDGWAGTLHGSNYATDDVELLVEPSSENGERFIRALEDLGGRRQTVEAGVSSARRGRGSGWVLPGNPVTCWRIVPGVQSYDSVRGRAICMDLGPCSVTVAGLDDLIDIQREAGEPSDRILLEDLLELRTLVAEDVWMADVTHS